MMVPSDDSFISDEEEEFCPLCVEEMDISDKNFKPCPCGYQICQFCYNNIRQNPELNGRCPGCRRLYDDDSVEYKTISSDEYRIQQLKKEKREREKKQREKEKKETEMANKKHLAGLRVVQKNLVYVTGLNPPCSPDDLHSVLRSDKYFGQYGKILKIVINKKTPNPQSTHHHHQNPGLVVYVTFAKKEDALKCINELDGSLCDGRVLRAAHGTTKYCSSYLRGHPCPNPNCMFLHEPGEEADSYTRKDLSTQQGIKMGMMGLSGSRVGSNTNIHSGFNQQNTSSNNSQHTNSAEEDNEGSDDDSDHHTSSPNPMPNSASSSNGAVLPATAHWAKGLSSASGSPSVNSTALANAAAFPTLGEIFRDQKQQQRKESKNNKGKVGRSSKDNSILLPDDIDIDNDSAIHFMEETSEMLRSLSERREKLQVHFKKLTENADNKVLPLFAFNKNTKLSNSSNLEEEKLIARQVIERFILKPIKNYHLAYQNHPIIQQQTLLQQQAQLQQQRQQTPSIQAAQIQQLQIEQQKRLLEQQQSQQNGNGTPVTNNASLQQQQQLLLLQQLQQQQQQQQQQQPTPSQTQAQINMVRARERSANTSTPPPPGLFAGANGSKGTPHPPQMQAQPQQQPQGQQYAQQSAVGNQSSSSQLLTQLMSGKR